MKVYNLFKREPRLFNMHVNIMQLTKEYSPEALKYINSISDSIPDINNTIKIIQEWLFNENN